MQILLDSHVSPVVADRLRESGVQAVGLRHWRDGQLLHAADHVILSAAREDGLVLVTYDCRTIPTLLAEWASSGEHHAGVILVDDQTIRPDDVGGQVRALMAVNDRWGAEDWMNRVVYLPRAQRT